MNFRSIDLSEPGRVLFVLATDISGFAVEGPRRFPGSELGAARRSSLKKAAS